MSNKKEFTDIFDDDFEVTYEDDSDIYYDEDVSRRSAYDEDVSPRSAYDEDISRRSAYDERRHRNDDRSDREPSSGRSSSRRRKGRGVPLAAPIRKGGRTLSRLAAALVRSLTAILILAIMIYVGWTFWRASTPYGDIIEMIQTRNPTITLASYLCVAVLFILFELISLLWSMTRVRVRNGIDSWKEDTGRGMFSFIIVFVTSYLAFLLSPLIPEAPEAVYGIKGALDVYGSMHNVLFGLCAAGVVSCIVRKYFA